MTPSPPNKLGRYEVLEEIGKGAMGVVYLARDPLIGRLVALKTFRIGFSAKDHELQQFRSRFVREAQSAGILSHPNIVTIHDVVDEGADGTCFIAMEFVKGTNLKQLLQRPEPFTNDFLVGIVAQIAEALDYAHSRGVVHRDIKPANILITPDEKVKITDFGIARLDTSNLTMEGQLLGTPNYMAPEQILGKEVDHRADIFSLGVVLYEMLTGEAPFVADSVHGILYQVLNHTPPAPSTRNSQSPPLLDLIVAKALAKNLEQRYDNAKDLAQDLRQCRDMLAARAAAPQFTAGTAAPSAGAPRLGIPGTGERTGGLGLSQTFDSHEATMRLAALSSADAEPMERTQRIVPEAGTPAPGRAAPSPARRDGFGDSIYLWLASALAVAAAVALIWAR